MQSGVRARVDAGQLIVASNRLPVIMRPRDEGGFDAEPASGGLVSAMVPVLEQRGGAWVGWPGVTDVPAHDLRAALAGLAHGHDVVPVELSSAEREAFYHGFSNEIAWPLFHDLQTNCNFDPAYWDAYVQVNERFARAIAERARPGDVVWIHDYHLMLAGAALRRLGVDNRVGFFLHIPFPDRDIFRKLPWREPIAEAFLAYDLVGLQTPRDRTAFVRSIDSVGSVEVARRAPDGRILAYRGERGRMTFVGEFPIGVDFAAEQRDAQSAEAAKAVARFARDLPGRRIILGVDRLDYTKGVPQRLLAFREALHRYPELRGTTTLVQVVVPSREEIASYASLREEIERLVGQINGELSEPGWVPVLYLHHSIERRELRGWYQAAHVALITPLKDGMNLVSKEYVAARIDEQGALVLSEFAGSAAQLAEGALLVNPNDRVAVADAIARACHMDPPEQRARMRRMREIVRDQDVFFWADAFLGQLGRLDSESTRIATGT